jgi:hypothetical protein
MNWLAFLLTLIKVVEALSSYLSDRRLISAEDAKVAADAVARVHNALVAGNAIDVSPQRLRDHDSNQRD